MTTRDQRVTAYIANAPEYARPILERLRALVHRGCPDVEETIKWGMPYFMHGRILCFMGAFQKHCVFGLRQGVILKKNHAMGHFGRITGLADLPDDAVIVDLVDKAARLDVVDIKLRP